VVDYVDMDDDLDLDDEDQLNKNSWRHIIESTILWESRKALTILRNLVRK
jgi:hypothetical protein